MATYVGRIWPEKMKQFNEGFSGLLKNAFIIGERLSPLVAVGCLVLAINNLFFRA